VCGEGTQSNYFDSRMKWVLGDGKIVRFWDDRWVGYKLLKEKFLTLYLFSQCKKSVVRDLGKWNNDTWR